MTTFIWSQSHQTPFGETQPHGRPASSTGRHIFAQCFTQTFHAPGARETASATGLSGIGTQAGTHPWYALPRAQRQQVRTSGSHPLTRAWCEPSQWLPRWLTREVTNPSGCHAMVSTVVSRVLQWFPLETRPGPDKTHGAGSTGRRARSAPALSVEFNSPCRSQHAGAGIYFDHTLTECETGVRRNPGRAGVRGLSHTGAVKQRGLAVSHPRQTPDEILDRLWTDRGATMRQRLAGRPYL